MTNIIRRIKYQWWWFKIVVLGMKPDWLYEPDPCFCPTEPFFKEGDLIFDKDTETVWVVCGAYTEEVFAYRLNDDLDFQFFLSDQVIKMNY